MEKPNNVPPLVAQTKTWRRDLDVILDDMQRGSKPNYTGPRAPDHPVRSCEERSTAIRKLKECIMWLGMDLKAQNEPNPYPSSKDPASPVIEPTADGLKL